MTDTATQVELLQYRVEELERALGLKEEFPPIMGLSKRQSQLLGLLQKNKLVSRDRLFTAMYADSLDGELPSENIVGVMLSHLRKRLSPFGVHIRNEWGVGWYLDADSKLILSHMSRTERTTTQREPARAHA